MSGTRIPELEKIANELRELLKGTLPSGAIDVIRESPYQHFECVGIMLQYTIEDDGDAESGPHISPDVTSSLIIRDNDQNLESDWVLELETEGTAIASVYLTADDSGPAEAAQAVVKFINAMQWRLP